MKDSLTLHHSHIDDIAIRSELRYLIGENAFAAGPAETHG
jgi:hypothetical protein